MKNSKKVDVLWARKADLDDAADADLKPENGFSAGQWHLDFTRSQLRNPTPEDSRSPEDVMGPVNANVADFKPADGLYGSQWHLGFIGSLGYTSAPSGSKTAGIERVWNDFAGKGVSVGIWDTGVQRSHWDLDANYDASKHVVIDGTLNDGQPLTSTDRHGTAVAGIIAGEDNAQGGVGVAFDASITSIRVFGGADDMNTNYLRYLKTLDSLGQFDVTNHSYGSSPNFRTYADIAKFETAANIGRNGLGTLSVKSAGNNNVDGNGEAVNASRFTVTVAAVDSSSSGNAASYSTYGSHVLVSAPAASVTTDLMGSAGYNGLLNGDYTNIFGGTSAAAPVTAGVIALMLDANPALGWRDVQNILAYSAAGTGSLYTGVKTNENFSWKWTGAENWNGGGLHFSEDYGYGMVNAYNAVRMSEAWSIFHPQAATSGNEVSVATGKITVNQNIADLSTLNHSFTVNEDINLEHVSVKLSLTHTNFTNLRMRLISPDGTALSLYDGSTGNASTSDYTFTYTFGVDGLRGVSSKGTWTLQVQDAVGGDSGRLSTIYFTGYGSQASINDVYHYTDEVFSVLAQSGQSDRLTLADPDGGVDWINATAMTGDVFLDLNAGQTSSKGGAAFLVIENGTTIENAICGDGNDHIVGNAGDNLVYGMRGDDILVGGAGIDTAGFLGAYVDYAITAENGFTTVRSLVDSLDGTDVLMGFEWLKFSDLVVKDPSVDFVAGGAKAPVEPIETIEPIKTIEPIETIVPIDALAPQLIHSSPSDNATAVVAGANLILSFDEEVQAGSGNIRIYQSSGVLWNSIAATDTARVAFEGKTVTVDPLQDLAINGSYYVQIDKGAIVDLAGNPFAGIADATSLNFQTEISYTYITGNLLANRLIGTDSHDSISGLAGNDLIYGKMGNDILNGGAGYDNFVFDTALGPNNIDSIDGFEAPYDTIRLENAIFTKLTSTGILSSAYFRSNGGGVALDSNDYILHDTSTGNLFYDADGNGAAEAMQFATLMGVTGTLTQADFLVI